MPAETWDRAKRLLCVRLDSMGDVLMTSPALRALRESVPGRHITLLTSSSGTAIARLIPEVDAAITYDPPWMKHTPPRESPIPETAMIEQLRCGGFDGAVIFTVFSQNPLPAAFMCYMAGIPLRLAHCHENPYQLLTDWVPDPEPTDGIRHEVQRQLDLVANIGARTSNERLSLTVPPAADDDALRALVAAGVDPDRPWCVVHPGATAASRRYPPELFADVVKGLAGLELQVVLTGSPAERPLVATIADSVPAANVAGALDLPAFAALLARAPLLVSNNTGPVHIASAVGTPVVDIYALTNPQHTPWGVPSRVLSFDVPCRNCFRSECPVGHHDCLRRIPPQQVVAAAADLLAEASRFDPGTAPTR